MTFNLQSILLISLIILLTACGSPPLLTPARTENISQNELAVQAEPPAVLAIVGGSANSPLAPPTASADPTSNPALPGARPSETPYPSETPNLPTQTPRPTLTPHPTQKPSPPTPTVVSTVSPGIPVKEYIFGTPEELQGLEDSVIKEWVSGSVEEMVVIGNDFLDIVNILTGKEQRLAKWDAEVQFIASNPVWLQSTKVVALILGNLETKQYELWISTPKEKTTEQAYLTNIERSFIPVGTDTGLGVYDLESKILTSVTDDGKVSQTEAAPLQVAATMPKSLPYKVIQRDGWVAYYNRDNFIVMNLKTKATKEIEFTDEYGRPLSAWDAQWSWDGNKLAVLVSQRDSTLTFKDLYVYDLASNTSQKIQTPFTHYIDTVAWAPDNRYVIVNAVIGQAEYKTSQGAPLISDANALFLVDIVTMENSPIRIHPPDIASSIGNVLWSSDGKSLVTRYRFFEGQTQTYLNKVKIQ